MRRRQTHAELMAMREVPSLVDRLVGGCFAVLLGCLALYGAVLASIVVGGAWAVRRWWQF